MTGGELHAYLIHQTLNQRFVVPIPDVWMMGLVAIAAKATTLLIQPLKTSEQRQQLGIWLAGTTVLYAAISLQLYASSLAVLLPIALLTLISSSITTRILSGRSIQVLAQTQDDRRAEADRLLQQGLEQHQTSQFQAALQSWQQALEIYREIGDRAREGIALSIIGMVYIHLEQTPQALEFLQQALSIDQEVGDQVSEGGNLSIIGLAYANLGQNLQALEYFPQALSIM